MLKLNPEINVCTIIEEWDEELEELILVHPNRIEIEIKHNFVFDNRLIPSDFNGIIVKNITIGEPYPKEFYDDIEENVEIPFYMLESPEKYTSYVKQHLNRIRIELKAPNMTMTEALDALTGGFENHQEWFNDVCCD